MTSKEILQALQTGEISLEEAKNRLTAAVKAKAAQPPHSSISSAGQGTSNQPGQPVVDSREVAPGIVQVTMQDRTHKNAFSEELASGLIRAFTSLQANSSYKVAIITGYDGYFFTGGTPGALLSIHEGKIKCTHRDLYRLALDCKIPVIAAMQGHAFGIGWSMGMFADFVVMSREGIYSANFMKLGFTPGAGATVIFPEKFGHNLAREILFTGKKYTGEELEAKGAPFPVLPAKEVLPYAIQLATTLSDSPGESLIALKEHMAAPLKEKLERTIEQELGMHEKTFVNQPGVKQRIQALSREITGKESLTRANTAAREIKDAAPPANAPVNPPLWEPIAVIGMSGQFPKSRTLTAFWDNLVHGRDCVSEIPAARWPVDRYYHPDPKVPGKTYCKWMGALEDVDRFDPLFFNISPTEAGLMDPQQRLFLENCWRCIEDSGNKPSSLSGSRCGVFVGCAAGDYERLLGEQGLNAQGLMGGAISILSARISYLLNLKGPCLAIDTACSSSLVALAEACNSLVLRTTDLALAGGVCVLAGPALHIMTGKAGMLSGNGRCFTFDQRANGFVPGEGVGVLLLKRLSDAVRHQDPIYGVIRGWGINQDGKTNGITAPSVNSQILLEKDVYQRFNINPAAISLVEAHGTGTKLGDPIEVEALTESFRAYTREKNYCALGSVKSNIGHLLAAAGVAGVVKVLLALRHRMLPPTIHFETLNDHISLDHSPFYINTRLKSWETAPGVPRCACVSSFGFSGTNAHMVIEEYLPGNESAGPAIPIDIDNPILFVLSAKSPGQLKDYARDMKLFSESGEKPDLVDMAYTLQVGREEMEHRLAILADSRETLLKALQEFIDGHASPAIFTGRVEKGKDGAAVLERDEAAKAFPQERIHKKNLKEAAKLWVKGLSIDWNPLYDSKAREPRKISLPTYPFAGESYWRPRVDTGSIDPGEIPTAAAAGTVPHPLLQQNTSTLGEQRYSSTFTGREFFLADHVVKGQRVLPGVAYLEMARAALEQAAPDLAQGAAGIRLKNVVWLQPLAVEAQPVQVHIRLFPGAGGEIAFEIYSGPGDGEIGAMAHCRGSAAFIPGEEAAGVLPLDLADLRTRCSRTSLDSHRCRELFRAMDIEYGPAHQGIEQLYVGDKQALARLSLPAVVSHTADQFVLHPSMMDSALQASIGLMMGPGDTIPDDSRTSLQPLLPFALQELDVFGNCTAGMWARVRLEAGNLTGGNLTGDGVRKIDADLCDQQGKVCVRVKGFTTRALKGDTPGEPADGSPVGTFMLTPVWDALPIERGQAFPANSQGLVIAGGSKANQEAVQKLYPRARVLDMQSCHGTEAMVKELETHGDIDHILWIAPSHEGASLADDSSIDEQDRGVLQCFRLIKALLHLDWGTRDLGWTVITTRAQAVDKNDRVNPTHAGVHGLMGVLAKEYPQWRVRLLDLETDIDWPFADIFTLPPDRQGHARVYRGGQWYRQQLVPVDCAPPARTLYRTGGVYVVIGGAGTIGEAWSEYMIRTYQARVTWIGRRPKDAAVQAKLDRLAALGPAPSYIEADAADKEALRQAYEEIKREYPRVHGVIHSAIVLREQSLADMEEEQFLAGLAAKVDVCVRIAQIFHQEPLDFVLFFSSIIAFIKNPYQSHYAAGCTFKDAFARQLSQKWSCPVKVINWGYWGSDRVDITEANHYYRRLARVGIGLLEPPEAMKALEILLAGPIDQAGLLKTTKSLPVEGMNPGESITTYPVIIPANVLQVQSPTSAQGVPDQAGKPGKDFQPRELEEFLCKLLWGQLRSLGFYTGKEPGIAHLEAKSQLSSLYRRWFEESTAVLVRNNYLRPGGESYVLVDESPVDLDALWKEWDEKKALWLDDPGTRSRVILVEATLRALPGILTGKRPATEVIFPHSSMELVEGIYRGNPGADYFNGVLAEIAAAYIRGRLRQDPTVKVRILEIGAGTGGTSAAIFSKIQPYRDQIQEYCYTDISRAFLQHGEKVYGADNPYLTFQIFNVEESPAGQGIEAGAYDIVIAANVLHATRNIRHTLRNAKAIIRNNGLLLLNEMSCGSLFAHLTFGLLEGWWLYEDPGLRIPGCPGLSPQSWQRVLESEGYGGVFFPAHQAQDCGQQVITAESNGIVRQKKPKPDKKFLPGGPGGAVFSKKSPPWPPEAKNTYTSDLLQEKTTAYLKNLVGKTLGIPVNKIDSSEPLEKYGIDSIFVVQLTDVLREVFTDISSTLFFEHQTIDALAGHFIKTRKHSLIELLGIETPGPGKKINGAESIPFEPSPTVPGPDRPAFRKSPCFRAAAEPGPRERDVAIIGLAGRYPLADNLEEFWNNLKAGRNCITEIPGDRWDWRQYFDEEKGKAGAMYSKWGGFMRDIDKFDPMFFQVSPAEAETMDPQERLFLEMAYAGIEDAGYTPGNLCAGRKVGVFAGVMNCDYPTGPNYSSIANRVSYHLNFQGPSIVTDTACSSSLTAIHLALESLYSGTSECALAGGVNAIVDPVHYLRLSAKKMLSPGNRCKAFGDRADGFVDGEGVGVVVLKPLRQAAADGDHIYAVIKGSMVNAGGKTNGYTVPNPNAQSEVVSEALARAGVNAGTISYLEAHGTGTSLGDPIEIAGLTKTFEQDTTAKQFCALGSVKSNIGHCESAAGIAGLTKVLLQMKHRQLVPSLNAGIPNPEINFAQTPFVVQQELALWKAPLVEIHGETREYPRRAGISSFGGGGANAHIVIEEYTPGAGGSVGQWVSGSVGQSVSGSVGQWVSESAEREEREQAPGASYKGFPGDRGGEPCVRPVLVESHIIILSAKNEERLLERVRLLLAAIRERRYTDADLADIAYTLQVGREAMEERLAVTAASLEELREKLQGFIDGREDIPGLFRGRVKRDKETLALFTADEDMAEAIAAWISKRKYSKLLDLWVKGLIFDWQRMYEGTRLYKPRRISLPTYPFARERCWITPTGTAVSDTTRRQTTPAVESPADFELMTFEEVWQEQTLPDALPGEIKTMVCFLSGAENQQGVIDFLRALPRQTGVIFISQNPGAIPAGHSRQNYSVDKTDVDTYKEAFRGIRAQYGEIDTVFYLWPLEDPACIREYSYIVYMLQALASTKLPPRRLLLAAQFENPLEGCYLDSWIGFERSLRLILPNTRVSVIYQETREQDREISIKDWMRKLQAELSCSRAQSVMYREGKRYVCRVRPTSAPPPPDSSLLKPGGTYLVTGGLGGLGRLFAGHFAQKHPVNLLLTGRTPLDEEKQAKIKALEEQGSRVFYGQADVSSAEEMKETLTRAKELFGKIDGVIHAAGIQGRHSLLEKDPQSFHQVLDPKINGTLVLDELLREEPLDFTCYFSSASAVLGDFGSCDYAIANRFQMAYAQYRDRLRRQGKRQGKTIVINWPLWKEGGMGFADDDSTGMYLESSGQCSLPTREGLAIFDRLLAQNNIQHLVLMGKPQRVHRFLGLTRDPAPAQDPGISTVPGKGRRPELEELSLEQCLQWDLKEYISRLLKIPREKLSLDQNLADFGFDSINLAEFAKLLTRHYEIDITPDVFFGYSTIEKLSRYFLTRHGEAVAEFYREAAAVESGLPPVSAAAAGPRLDTVEEPGLVVKIPAANHLEPIAIIGMSGRFPGARDIEEMWRILAQGQDMITEIPGDRFDWRDIYGDPLKDEGKTNGKWCGCIPGVREFDPLFFEISPLEAEQMDPRQRLLLQESWRALEDAGYGPARVKSGKIGMFVGVEEGDYRLLALGKSNITANHNGILAARLAYFLNLSAPVMAINTACSSGLTAAHQACVSLRQQECETAIAAGVSLLLTPLAFVEMGQAGMLSGDGKCFAFDRRANGMVPGEAVAVVVLKRLSQALADGDPIYAVIQGSGINYDGKTNGITAPGRAAQTNLLTSVYDRYRVNPGEIEYIVTHGTGTKLGDPVEVNALNDAFKGRTHNRHYCALTSPKTNFGHTFAASGLVGLISLVQALRYETIPASLHCEQENEYIDWKTSPFYVNKTARPWPREEGKTRIGAVSAFGVSGTNAHMVVRGCSPAEAPAPDQDPEQLPYYLLALSARTREALREKIRQMITVLENKDCQKQDLSSMSLTLLTGRHHFGIRCAVVAREAKDAVYAWKQLEKGSKEKLPHLFQGEVPGDFTGQKGLEEYGKNLLQQSRSRQEPHNEYREILRTLADLYCQGYELPWERLWGNVKPRRMHLPGYPFAREHYWITGNPSAAGIDKDTGPVQSRPVRANAATLMFEPHWREQDIGGEAAKPVYAKHLAIFCEPAQEWNPGEWQTGKPAGQEPGFEIIQLSCPGQEIEQRYRYYTLAIFAQIRDILAGKPGGRILIQVVVPFREEQRLFPGLAGLLKTAHQENPKLLGQLIEIAPGESPGRIPVILAENSLRPGDRRIRHQRGQRWVLDWKEIDVTRLPADPGVPWKDGGVYLITGGTGGLGMIFTREIVGKVKDVVLVLAGRSPLDSRRQAQIRELEKLGQGARIVYRQADVTHRQAAADLVRGISRDFNGLNGIIHCAGVNRDNFIIKKDPAELQEVLGPKVAGLVYLDEASREAALDFFILFSSAAGVMGNSGQADYAAANAFMDAYAGYRNTLAAGKQRRGQTISIDWPLWEQGGMRIHEENQKIIRQNTGAEPIKTSTALRAFYQALAVGKDQVMIMQGDPVKMREHLRETGSNIPTHPAVPHPAVPHPAAPDANTGQGPIPTVEPARLHEKILHRLKVLLAGTIKLGVDRIDAREPLEKYGIDSIIITQLNQKLAEIFENLSKTLFFEYRTLDALTGYLLEEYPRECGNWVGPEDKIIPRTDAIEANPGKNDNALVQEKDRDPMTNYKQNTNHKIEPIAIIGMSACFPGAKTLNRYWDNLKAGKDCIREIPPGRWSLTGFFHAPPQEAVSQGKSYSKWGGFLGDFSRFDPLFFNISPREALNMDPQERLFIQACWEVLEDAGYTRQQLAARYNGQVGVFAGITKTGFDLYGPGLWQQGEKIFPYTSFSSVANRVSYLLDLRGPSMPVDTMCSSSLTAIHEACEYIQRRECELAIAGGVNLYLHPANYVALCAQFMLSPEGKCKSFGKGGNGFVPGEGVGVVLLKPLARAEADRDHIYAVIRGTAINHGGKTNGYTVPNPTAQGELIRKALDRAGINARAVSYVEAHGTGTELGDPIEITGLCQAFGEDTRDTGFCAIGSVKSNIGHLEAAAGIAGLAKIILQMKHRQLVPSLHARELNPNIDFSRTPFVVQQELAEWKAPVVEIAGETREFPRIAGISSFGAGGANAHVIIQEYIPPHPPRDPAPPTMGKEQPVMPVIVPLSARNEEQLRRQVERLLAAVGEKSFTNACLADIAYTLQVGREPMEERLAVMVESREELHEKLKDFLQGRQDSQYLYRGQVKRHKETLAAFTHEEEIEEAIDKWIQRGKFAKLPELWVKGLPIDWEKLYRGHKGQKPRRISLPTYPFAGESYWLAPGNVSAQEVPAPAPGRDIPGEPPVVERKMCFLKKHWQLDGPGAGAAASTPQVKGTIAILTTEETGDLAALVSRHFPGSQILDSREMQRQTREPQPWGMNYNGCVDLSGCGQDKNSSMLPQRIAWLQRQIQQARGDEQGLMLLGVTRGLESYENHAINLSGAAHAGLYRMLQSEYSHLRSRHLDVEPAAADQEVARQIADEFFLDTRDPEVCYRGGKRYRACLQEYQPGHGNREPALTFPTDHVLWITGGTRGLGALCARHFVQRHGVRRLVLTGREELPPRQQWDALCRENNMMAQKIRTLRELEDLGARVQVLSTTSTDETALEKSLEQIKKSMGPVGGIIHCAGLVDTENPAFIRKPGTGIQRVLAPKVEALDLMIQIFKKEPLQFFVLFSSVSAIIPALAVGQSDYAMANAYMDYAAEALTYLTLAARGAFFEKTAPLDPPQKLLNDCYMVSIQWPGWKETGMGEVKTAAYRQTGLLGLSNEEGLFLLDEILSGKSKGEPVVLPAVVNPAVWEPRQLMRQSPAAAPAAVNPGAPPMKPGTAGSSEALSKAAAVSGEALGKAAAVSGEALGKAAEAWLISLFSAELYVEPSKLQIDTPFQDYGLDSILLTQILAKINQKLMTAEDLDPSALYEHPTIEAFAAWLVKNHKQPLSEALGLSNPGTGEAADPVTVPRSPVSAGEPAAPLGGLTGEFHRRGQGNGSDIAVIGLSCRFPGADNLEEYWQLLLQGRSAIGPVPRERWGYDSSFYAGLLDNITHFDGKFFLIPEEDARVMDPQAFLLLAESLKLWYHAGYNHHDLKGKPVGVFLGGRSLHQPDFSTLQQARNPIVAVGQNYLAANICQFFDLRGPALVLDTACSSALVGMNMAIQALRGGEIESALVGGVNLLNTDGVHRLFQQRGILSREPLFHIFDRRAGGVVLGEGVGVVLLKTIERALADGDHIYAVIKGIAINNDGRSAGPATPNPEALKGVMKTALARSGKKPGEISYIEVNGSGSQVTDLLELKAIQSVYRSGDAVPCALGSMKPNIGHPLCAEGIAGFIKVVLMLHHRQMVPFLSGQQPMKHYDLESSPFYLCRQAGPWTAAPRAAAINCFADGGTNAHVILEAWTDVESCPGKRHPLSPPALQPQPIYRVEVKKLAGKRESRDILVDNVEPGKMFWEIYQ